MEDRFSYQSYGTKAKAEFVKRFIRHIIQSNLEAEGNGSLRKPICIWGAHGIGKTEIIRSIAQEDGFPLVQIAPAQFEEMGDLLGMPAIVGQTTVFRAPSWVPTEKGPGILLIDDVNRADDRILRGIMQLLQDFKLVSWALPAQWQILLTANPEGGNYSVTPLDSALLTRMMHITLVFDVKSWAVWAEKEGIDERGINFVLMHPDVIHGERTSPRTIVQFFESIASIPDLLKEIELVRLLANACLDDHTTNAFLSFVQENMGRLPGPELLLNAKDFYKEVEHPLQAFVHKKDLRVDILAAMAFRLINFLKEKKGSLKTQQLENLKKFLSLSFLPNDIRFKLAQELTTIQSAKALLADPYVGAILLEEM